MSHKGSLRSGATTSPVALLLPVFPFPIFKGFATRALSQGQTIDVDGPHSYFSIRSNSEKLPVRSPGLEFKFRTVVHKQ